MSQLFRGRGDPESNQRLERELASLEEQTRTASSGYETQFLNRAGNLCVEAGMPQRALAYFGRAIDAYLESGRFSAAEVLCRKVLRIAPEGKEGLASRQLVMMAEAATRIELRERLAEHLLEIGAEEDADRVLGAVFAERNGLRPPPPQDEGKLWAKLLRAALMGPQELKDQRPQTPEEGHDGEAAYLPSLGDQAESE